MDVHAASLLQSSTRQRVLKNPGYAISLWPITYCKNGPQLQCEYEAFIERLGPIPSGVLVYPASALHVTIATLLAFTKNIDGTTHENDYAKILAAASSNANWPSSSDGTLRITMGAPTLSQGFVGILMNSCNEFTAMRRCICEAAADILSPAQLEHLTVPNIVHSTFLRLGSSIADSTSAQFRRRFEAAAAGWSPVTIGANRARLVCESVPYMHMPLPPDSYTVSVAAFSRSHTSYRKSHTLRRKLVLPSHALHQVITGMLSLAPCASYHAIALVCKRWRNALCSDIRSWELLRLMVSCLLYCDESQLLALVAGKLTRFEEGRADNTFARLRAQPHAAAAWLELLGEVQRACRVVGRLVLHGRFELEHPVGECIGGWGWGQDYDMRMPADGFVCEYTRALMPLRALCVMHTRTHACSQRVRSSNIASGAGVCRWFVAPCNPTPTYPVLFWCIMNDLW